MSRVSTEPAALQWLRMPWHGLEQKMIFSKSPWPRLNSPDKQQRMGTATCGPSSERSPHTRVCCSLMTFSTERFSPSVPLTWLSLLFLWWWKFLWSPAGAVLGLCEVFAPAWPFIEHIDGKQCIKSWAPALRRFVLEWQRHPLESCGGWMGLQRKLEHFPLCISQDQELPYFAAAWNGFFPNAHQIKV